MNYKKQNKKLKIGHLNVRSLFTGFDSFTSLITKNKFDIMCTTETWLNDNLSANLVHIQNFNFFYKNRIGRGGGVGIYVRNDIVCKEVLTDFTSIDGLEYLFLVVKISNLQLLVCVMYRAPSSNAAQAVEHIDNLLSFITPQYENICILGDVNIDQTHDNILADCLLAYDFIQIINEPTRITVSTEKLIDVIFINNSDLILNSGTMDSSFISDHRVVYGDLNLYLHHIEPKIITYRDFRDFSHGLFSSDLESVHWDEIFYLNSIDDKIKFLSDNILMLFDKHAPYITSRVTKHYAPWITASLKQLMFDRNKAHQKYKKSKNISDLIHYKQLRNLTVSTIRREKVAYLAQYQDNFANKELWKALNTFNIKKKQNHDIPNRLANVNEINNYFSSVYSQPNNCPDSVNNYIVRRFDNNLHFQFELVTVEKIKDIILNLKSNASGCDGISAKMLKFCSSVICKHILHIINCCLEAGYFPAKWKLSIIKPLPKVTEPLEYSDLRPITMIPTLAKILEKVVQLQLYDYVIEHKIVSNLQSGFRKGYSTATLLSNITDNIFGSLDQGKATALVLLDFSKAFDTLDHELLCAKLTYYGFSDTAVNFFASYLSNRMQIVTLKDTDSCVKPISSGVPQGSVLGPILFLIYTADIFNCVQHSDIFGYADDTQLTYTFDIKNINIANEVINNDLNSISVYSKENNLKLNSKKCTCITFSSNADKHILISSLNLHIDNQPLLVVNSVKNLGIILDNSLRFKDHVLNLIRKCYTALKLLYTNISILNFKFRKKLCESLVLSILNYCIVLYFPCLDKFTQNRLQKIQNSCCRFVYRIKKYDHVSCKLNQLGWLRLENLYKYHLSVFVHNILVTNSPPYLREKFMFRHNIHTSNLRYTSKLSLPKYHKTIFRRSFSYNAVIIYNNLADNIKSLPVNKFRKMVKLHFLSCQ